VRESAHDELDGMTYFQDWESNEKRTNTFITNTLIIALCAPCAQ